MTSFAQPPFDIDSDPFVVQCRKIISSLKLQVGTTCVKSASYPNKWVLADSYYLYFDEADYSPAAYDDFFIKAFADKKECHPPVRILSGNNYYISTFYKQNFRFSNDEVKPHFWEKEPTLVEKEKIISFLNKYVIQYFYDYLSF